MFAGIVLKDVPFPRQLANVELPPQREVTIDISLLGVFRRARQFSFRQSLVPTTTTLIPSPALRLGVLPSNGSSLAIHPEAPLMATRFLDAPILLRLGKLRPILVISRHPPY